MYPICGLYCLPGYDWTSYLWSVGIDLASYPYYYCL